MLWDIVKGLALLITAVAVFYMIYISVKYPHADDYPHPWENK